MYYILFFVFMAIPRIFWLNRLHCLLCCVLFHTLLFGQQRLHLELQTSCMVHPPEGYCWTSLPHRSDSFAVPSTSLSDSNRSRVGSVTSPGNPSFLQQFLIQGRSQGSFQNPPHIARNMCPPFQRVSSNDIHFDNERFFRFVSCFM